MTKFRSVTDERMFKVAEHVVNNQIKGITTTGAFMEAVGSIRANYHNINNGKQSFTISQILSCCKQFNISADFIYGLTNVMHRKQSSNPLEKIKAAVAELEQQTKLK